jgi:anti-sigma B factor antagonist
MAGPAPFLVNVERSDLLLRLTPRGELDLATAAILEHEFDVACASGATLIEVDLRQLSFLDSSGIHLLIRMGCACIGEDRLRMVAGTALVDPALALTGVRDRLPIARASQAAPANDDAADRRPPRPAQ